MTLQNLSRTLIIGMFFMVAFGGTPVAVGQVLIPGTGTIIEEVGDDFEDEAWTYDYQLPKVYNFKDDPTSKNLPLGQAANGRWYEGQKRGQPDIIARVETPPNGLPGSKGALLLRSKTTGQAYPSNQQQQDDFIGNVSGIVGKIPVSKSPSVVTRVWFPPIEEWEERSGCHFAFRISLETNPPMAQGRFRRASYDPEDGLYWPGFFLNRELPTKDANGEPGKDRFYFWLKATADSRAIPGPEVTEFGWWTLGISTTPDGKVHYFAKPGLEDLTEKDYVASAFPFGNRAIHFRSFFFNVCNGDDGRTWSTPFIIDDPKVFLR